MNQNILNNTIILYHFYKIKELKFKQIKIKSNKVYSSLTETMLKEHFTHNNMIILVIK